MMRKREHPAMRIATTWLAAVMIAALCGGVAVAADYGAPADFRVTDAVAQPDPGAFTATIDEIPGDRPLFVGGEFEPLCFRTKVEAGGDAPNEIITGGWSTFTMYRTGFWDGAEVRVYRPRDGKLVKVRESHIATGGYVAEGWHRLPGFQDRLVDVTYMPAAPTLDGDMPTLDADLQTLDSALDADTGRAPAGQRRLRYQDTLTQWPRPTIAWYSITAVDAMGRESERSSAVKVSVSGAGGDASPMNAMRSYEEPRETPAAAAPPAPPTAVKGSYSDGMLTLSWMPSDSGEVVGYRVYVTATDPATHRGFHLRLADQPTGEWEHLRDKDIVFLSKIEHTFSRLQSYHPWQFNEYQAGYCIIAPFPDEMGADSWSRVAHPQPVPEAFADPGETCLRVDLRGQSSFRLGMYAVSTDKQDWYQVLQPGVTYVAEGWARHEGKEGADLHFEIEGRYPRRAGIQSATWALTEEWQHVRTTFTPSYVYTDGPTLRTVFELRGHGTFWLDNLRIYREDPGYLQPDPLVIQRTRESGLESLRFHTHIKSGWSQTMEMLTNAPGLSGVKGHDRPASRQTLPALLAFCRETQTNPWLQIEMCMSEREWLGLVEYLAAPYDPAVDTPAAKPWAAKRYAQGQAAPWIDVFDRLTFEISNETWNRLFGPWTFHDSVDSETGRAYRSGETYGLFQEYVLGILRQSPYWTDALAAKFRSVLGGWALQSGSETGYGPSAIIHSPSTDLLTVAGYNGGWDEGENAAEMNDAGLFRSLTFWAQRQAHADGAIRMHDRLVGNGRAHDYGFGTYEAGPGYALAGLNDHASMSAEQVEAQDQVGKSLATGVSTLDAFLGRAALGFRTQNFFTLQFNRRYWTSHAALARGGHPYPSWLALQLYNTQGTGDFLTVTAASVPTLDLPGFARRQASADAPMVACYATRSGDRVSVFLISRKLGGFVVHDKQGNWRPDFDRFAALRSPTLSPDDMRSEDEPDDLGLDGALAELLAEEAEKETAASTTPSRTTGGDGFTPTTVRLPFTSAKSVTLYKLSGDPAAHNLDRYDVQLQVSPDLPFASPLRLTTAITGEAHDGLPPCSIFLFVFDGIQP